MAGTYWLTVLAETSKLEAGIRSGVDRASRDAVISPKYSTAGASKAGQDAGRQIQSGVESETRGGLGRLFRTDGSQAAGAKAGAEINTGLASANVGRGLSSNIESNLGDGRSLGSRFGAAIATGLKGAAVVGAAGITAGIAGAMKAGISRSLQIEDAEFMLLGLKNSAEDVASVMANAREAVLGTAFGLGEAAATAATAVAAGIKPGQGLTDYLKTVADAAAISQTDLASMGTIFNNVQTAQRAMTQDFNMLPKLPMWEWLKKETGLSGDALKKFVEDGNVSAEMFRELIANNISDSAQKMGESTRGALKNMKSAYGRFGEQLATPFMDGLKPLALGFTAVFDDMTRAMVPIAAELRSVIVPWAEEMSARMTEWAKGGGIQNVMAFFSGLADRIKDLTSGGGADTMSSLSEGAKGLGTALASAGPALQTMGSALGAFGQAIIQAGPDTIQSIMVPAINLMAGALRFLADNASWAVPTLVSLVGAFVLMRSTAAVFGPIVNAFSAATQAFRTPLVIAQTMAIRQQAAAMTQLSVAMGTNTVAQNMNTVASNANTASTIRGRIAALGHAIATKAQAAATKAATMGQWLLNAAMTANPIGLVIAAVVAIGAALWAFFTKTETGRKLWDKIWKSIKAITSTVFEWMQEALTTVGEKLSWLWDKGKAAFDGIRTVAEAMWTGVKAVWDGFLDTVGRVADKVVAFKDALVSAFNTVKDTVVAVWDRIGGIFDKISDGLGAVGGVLSGAGNVIVNTLGLDGNARGGRITGPGTGTSDSILARLSNGEYVVNAASTAKYLPLLEAINSPGFAAGGLAASGKAPEGGLQGNSVLVARLLARMFPQIGTIGGFRADGGGVADHPEGRALDIMIPSYQSENGIALGNTITAFLMKNADKLNVDYTIWRQTYRNAAGGSNVMASYGNDTQDHYDHVHVTMKGGAPADYSVPTGLKLPGGLTNSMDGQAVRSVGGSLSASGTSVSTFRAATDSELSASGKKVDSAGNAVTQAQQRIDDLTYDVDKAQRRVDQLSSEGKDTTDAEEQLRRKTRELADANDKLADKRTALSEAEEADAKLRTDGKKVDAKASTVSADELGLTGDVATGASTTGKSGPDTQSLGGMFVSGVLESIGLDGSLFSNPLEWPSVKSLMAGVNYAGGLLSIAGATPESLGTTASAGGGGFASGAADAVGLGGLLSAIPSISDDTARSGSPALAPGEFNPGVAGGSVATASGSSMSAFAPHQGGGQAPGPAVDNSININGPVGMDPASLQTKLRTEQNARTRTTVRR